MEFDPSNLERALFSEQALKLAVVEMYLQGVSTRKVTGVMRQLWDQDVASTQVSRAAQVAG